MKQIIKFWLLVGVSVFCCSCSDSEKAKETVIAFLDALRFHDEAKMVELYPQVKNISPMLSFDEYTIKEVISKETCYEVAVLGVRNGDEKTNKTLKLYLPKEKHGEVISDTQGFTSIGDWKIFFLKSSGVFSDSHTDLTISKKVKEASDFWSHMYSCCYWSLKSFISCRFTWRTEGYSNDYAKCTGSVYNKSNISLTLKNLKGVFTNNGKAVGEVTFNLDHHSDGVLESHETGYFHFTDFNYHQADKLRIEFDIDEESILELLALASTSYSGDEYEKYKMGEASPCLPHWVHV